MDFTNRSIQRRRWRSKHGTRTNRPSFADLAAFLRVVVARFAERNNPSSLFFSRFLPLLFSHPVTAEFRTRWRSKTTNIRCNHPHLPHLLLLRNTKPQVPRYPPTISQRNASDEDAGRHDDREREDPRSALTLVLFVLLSDSCIAVTQRSGPATLQIETKLFRSWGPKAETDHRAC